jgi:hypothetical protein
MGLACDRLRARLRDARELGASCDIGVAEERQRSGKRDCAATAIARKGTKSGGELRERRFCGRAVAKAQ